MTTNSNEGTTKRMPSDAKINEALNEGKMVFISNNYLFMIYLPKIITNKMIQDMQTKIKDFSKINTNGTIIFKQKGKPDKRANIEEALQYVKTLVKTKEQEENENKDNYQKALLVHLMENDITIYSYFLKVGEYYHSKEGLLEPFELKNPFITEQDKQDLQDEKEDVNSFATRIIKRMRQHIIPEKEISEQKVKDDVQIRLSRRGLSHITLEHINVPQLDTADGFRVAKRPRAKKKDISGYDHQDESKIDGKITKPISEFPLDDGQYINFSEYLNHFKAIYHTPLFQDQNGQTLDFAVVAEAALVYCRTAGAFWYGKEYKELEIKTLADLEKAYTGEKGNFKGKVLTKGLYVKKEVLQTFFDSFKVFKTVTSDIPVQK